MVTKFIKSLGFFSIFIFTIIFVFFIAIYLSYDIAKFEQTIENRYSVSMLDLNDEILGVYLNDTEQYHLKSNYPISKNLKISVLTYEDKNFYNHNGIDFFALLRALKNNLIGYKKSGASTLTMQVAKMANPKKRTYFNKIKEIIIAYKLENYFSKDQILNFYLNNAPYGGNLIGYSTASEIYFKKKPIFLSWSEAALIAILPNAPGLINFEKNRHLLTKKRNRLLKRIYNNGNMEEIEYRLAIKEPIPFKKYPFKSLAPHLGRRLSNSTEKKIIKTTIDINIQKKMEKIVTNYADFLIIDNITNISLLVIDNHTYNVKAYVGSQNFLDFKTNGQIDGIISKRSPGSILKPFLYALGIDEGLISPHSKVPDVPLYFSNFKPRNASKRYSGMTSMNDALIKSLNIPFIYLLKEYSYDKFFYFLKEVLEFSEEDPNHYGLSLILGTKEMSLEEIGVLYTGLANYGNFRALNYLFDSDQTNIKENKKLISEGAAYLTLDTMKDLVRPGLENYYKWKNPISWKTGTSYGKKDAWACGITPEYTVIAWVGNFNGKGSENLSGVLSAGRLLFNVFKELEIKKNKFILPQDLKKIDIDTITGYRNIFSQLETKKILYPKKAKALRPSPYLKKIFVNNKDEEINSLSKDFINKKEKIILDYPIEVINYYIREKIDISTIYNKKIASNRSLKILYPTKNLKILLPRDFDGDKNMIIKIANLKNQNIYWYLNNIFISKDRDHKKEIALSNGQHTLTIVSETGERESVTFEIEKTR